MAHKTDHSRTRLPGGGLALQKSGGRQQFLLVARVRACREGPIMGGELSRRVVRHQGNGRGLRRELPCLGRQVLFVVIVGARRRRELGGVSRAAF